MRVGVCVRLCVCETGHMCVSVCVVSDVCVYACIYASVLCVYVSVLLYHAD